MEFRFDLRDEGWYMEEGKQYQDYEVSKLHLESGWRLRSNLVYNYEFGAFERVYDIIPTHPHKTWLMIWRNKDARDFLDGIMEGKRAYVGQWSLEKFLLELQCVEMISVGQRITKDYRLTQSFAKFLKALRENE